MKIHLGWATVLLIVFAVSGYFAGRHVKSSALSRESRLVDTIVLNTVYCRVEDYERRERTAVRLAFFDFLSAGERAPADGTALALIVEFIQKKISAAEVRDYLREEFEGINRIQVENCVFEGREQTMFMIAGGSPFVQKVYDGKDECESFLRDIEGTFIKYLDVN